MAFQRQRTLFMALATAAAGVLLVVAAVALVGQQVLVPNQLLDHPPTPSWLAGGERAVRALHERDANFPAVSREGSLGDAASVTGGKAKGFYSRRFSTKTSHAVGERGRSARRHGAIESAADEWQDKREKMYKAVRTFQQYGDSALEKLIPARKSSVEYKKALTQGLHEVARLKDARKEGQLVTASASGALNALEKGIQEQDALKREALHARDEGKEYAEKMKIADLKKKLALQRARDRRRENMIKDQLAGLVKQNKKLRNKDTKVSLEMEEVPAVGAREGNLVSLRHEIKDLQRSESSEVSELKDEFKAMEGQMKQFMSMKQQSAGGPAASSEQHKRRETGVSGATPVASEPAAQPQAANEQTDAAMQSKQFLDLVKQEVASETARARGHAGRDAAPSVQTAQQNLAEQMNSAGSVQSQGSDDGAECLPCVGGNGCVAGCARSEALRAELLYKRRMRRDVREGVNPQHDTTVLRLKAKMQSKFSLTKPEGANYASVAMGAASTLPDGEKFGPNTKHCGFGNCEPLESKSVNVESWGLGDDHEGTWRMWPVPQLDPSASPKVVRGMNQRKGRFAMYNRAGDEGVTTPSVSWGANSKMTSPDRSSGGRPVSIS